MKEDDKILDIDAGEYSLYFVRLPHLHLRKPEPLGMTEDLLFVGERIEKNPIRKFNPPSS